MNYKSTTLLEKIIYVSLNSTLDMKFVALGFVLIEFQMFCYHGFRLLPTPYLKGYLLIQILPFIHNTHS
jgi:hypothetical protein